MCSNLAVLFRLLLLRRLHLPLSPALCFCQCGRPLDSRGHHRAVCAQVGVLGRRGFAVVSEPPSTTAVVWRFLLRACHFMAAYSWPLTPFLCQPSIAMGPPVAAPLRLTALSLPKRADAKRVLIPNWSAPGGAPGVVLAGEVGGRWSDETSRFLSARKKPRPVVRVC